MTMIIYFFDTHPDAFGVDIVKPNVLVIFFFFFTSFMQYLLCVLPQTSQILSAK